MDPVKLVFFLSIVSNRIVETFVKPFGLHDRVLMVSAWVVGFVLVILTGANIFEGVFLYPIIGQVITAVAAGGGANLLSDIVKARVSKPDYQEPVK